MIEEVLGVNKILNVNEWNLPVVNVSTLYYKFYSFQILKCF